MKFSKSIPDKGNNKINVSNLPVNSIINSNNNSRRRVSILKTNNVCFEEPKNEGLIGGGGVNNVNSGNKSKNSKEQGTSIKFFQSSAYKRSKSFAIKNNSESLICKLAVKKK